MANVQAPETIMRDSKVWMGLFRGAALKCPHCGKGQLMAGYLKVRPVCEVCAHDNGHYRADDAPPYFTILIVGHLIVAPMLAFSFILTWPVWAVLATVLPSLLIATLLLLPRVKGAVIGYSWAVEVEPRGVEEAKAEA